MTPNHSFARQMPKYLLVYALCMLCFWGCYSAMDGTAPKQALIFQAVIFWLVNELWFVLGSLPIVLGAIFKWIKERKDVEESFVWRAMRWASLSLLVVPELIYGLLSVINLATNDALEQWLELPLSMGLYVASFVSVVLLFIIAFPAKIMGIGVINLLSDMEESIGVPNFDAQPAPRSEAKTDSPLKEYHSLSAKKHQQKIKSMLATDEHILLHTAPSDLDKMKDANQSFIVGFVLVGISLLFALVAVMYWQQASSALYRAIPVCGAIVFAFAALPSLRAKSRYKRILNNSDYFITNQAVYCCKLGRVRMVRYADKPRFALTLESQGYGRIEIIEAQSFAGKLFEKIQPDSISNASEQKGFQNSLDGLVHIAQAEDVLELLQKNATDRIKD